MNPGVARVRAWQESAECPTTHGGCGAAPGQPCHNATWPHLPRFYAAQRANIPLPPTTHLHSRAPGRYCLTRCYCGTCPHYLPIGVLPTNTPESYTVIDRNAVLSSTGRRANLAEYRQAQQEAARCA